MKKLIYILPLIALVACEKDAPNKHSYPDGLYEIEMNCATFTAPAPVGITTDIIKYCKCYADYYVKTMEELKNGSIPYETQIKNYADATGDDWEQIISGLQELKNNGKKYNQKYSTDGANDAMRTIIAGSVARSKCGTPQNPKKQFPPELYAPARENNPYFLREVVERNLGTYQEKQ